MQCRCVQFKHIILAGSCRKSKGKILLLLLYQGSLLECSNGKFMLQSYLQLISQFVLCKVDIPLDVGGFLGTMPHQQCFLVWIRNVLSTILSWRKLAEKHTILSKHSCIVYHPTHTQTSRPAIISTSSISHCCEHPPTVVSELLVPNAHCDHSCDYSIGRLVTHVNSDGTIMRETPHSNTKSHEWSQQCAMSSWDCKLWNDCSTDTGSLSIEGRLVVQHIK